MSADVIRIAGLAECSYADGPGSRFVIFAQGCPHRCEGCHNPDTHDPDGGFEADIASLAARIASSSVTGLTFSGGEPFFQAEACAEIARRVLEKRRINVMTYSGYTVEELLDAARQDSRVRALLTVSDYLAEGRFVLAQRDLTLRFRGSGNQRILDVTCYPNSENFTDVSDII